METSFIHTQILVHFFLFLQKTNRHFEGFHDSGITCFEIFETMLNIDYTAPFKLANKLNKNTLFMSDKFPQFWSRISAGQ